MNKDISQKTAPDNKSEIAKREEATLHFWETNDIFKKSEEKDAPKGEFVFYDGPPFATGMPHYGHILAGTIKDAIPRYRTMRGFRVPRRWGWDCHGLPLENEVEKELNLATKRDIEELGIATFNEAARKAVLRYAGDWEKIIPRLGRWVHMDRDYKTMDTSYTESVWWAFKTLFDRALIYEGFKSMHLCPRCGTTLSNFEVNLGYKDATDISVYVKFLLKGEKNTYVLAWTTTPWTLPGNMALAVGKDISYAKVTLGEDTYIVATDRLADTLKGTEFEKFDGAPITFLKGADLVGKEYNPLFDYYTHKDLEGKEKAWRVYHADYVSTEDGTGIVHIAPAFGEEDLALAEREGIPIVHHVTPEGVFAPEVADFAGTPVKPIDDPQSGDVEIIKYLARHGSLFKKQKITHSYPFCWRCDTPLLNYATSSWFVRVTDFKDALISENNKIGWVPKEVGESRFGKWLEGARDWAISRSRYWGAPLPVWKNETKKALIAIGSIDELKRRIKSSGNRYIVMRHGEALFNTKNVLNADAATANALTERGIAEVKAAAATLPPIDLIVHSPLERARQTAEHLAKELGLENNAIREEVRLREVTFGEFEGKPVDAYHAFFANPAERMRKAPTRGESWGEVKRRVGELLYECEKTYAEKTILFISHNGPIQMLEAASRGYDAATGGECIANASFDLATGGWREVPFVPLPHNDQYELDLHRPYIDEVALVDDDGTTLSRVPDVFDCWFESGSMPYAQHHYPFEKRSIFEPRAGWFGKSKGYPADFIAEGVDQTRGWFYSMLVLGVSLFKKTPYRNVIVNGLVLAEDGKKMSKRLKNYPDPMAVVERYGADALRYFLLSSPVVKGEDLSFSEKGVDEVAKKLIFRLGNVLSFYQLYAGTVESESVSRENTLDAWITARMQELIADVTGAMERYELDRATRPIGDFIDDLSTWYLRRSRERFKGEDENDKRAALATTREVLLTLSKVMAPFMPFYAEHVFRELRSEKDPESVHLCAWPEARTIDKKLLKRMQQVRDIVSRALEARAQAGIKVRQPLASLTLGPDLFLEDATLRALIANEVNVKDVIAGGADGIQLNTALSDELRTEGLVRELIRRIQQLRKDEGLSPHDTVALAIEADKEVQTLIEEFGGEIRKATLLSAIEITKLPGEPMMLDGHAVVLSLKK